MISRLSRHFLVCCALALLTLPCSSFANAETTPVIAIVIDDLGQQRDLSLAVTRLPGPVACSVLPHTPWAETVANAAFVAGKEVMLHLPLQAMETGRWAGVGEISMDNTEAELQQIFAIDLDTVPHAVGINNHMGSLMTRHPGHMGWLMRSIKAHGNLFFLDSYTTAQSVAGAVAREHGIATTRRHVFLDDAPGRDNLEREFSRLIALAKEQQFAVAIGHPYAETTAFLNEVLPQLESLGVRLVPVSELIAVQAALENTQGTVVAGAL